MKRIASLFLAAAMIFVLCACGSTEAETEKWSRTGSFINDDGDSVMITESETEEYEGWYVCLITDDAFYGGYIPQEGATLHGDIKFNEDDDPFVVTVSEEGEDGIQLETESGDTYHLVAGEYEAPEGTFFLKAETEGYGQLCVVNEGEEIVFDDENPYTSSYHQMMEPEKFVLGAKAGEGWKFVKWTKDGEDFSTEEIIHVEVTEDVDFVACFELADEEAASEES